MFYFVFFLLSILIMIVDKKKVVLPLNKILIIAVLIRLLIIFIFPNSHSPDMDSFIPAGEIILKGKSSYEILYFPFFPYLGFFSLLLKTFIHPFIFLKLLFTVYDLLVLHLVYLLSKKNLNTALLYAVNPITIICTNIHGQFDVIPLFFLLLGVYLFANKKIFSSVMSLSLAIYAKTWPFLFVTPLFKKAKNKLLFIGLAVFPLVSIIIHNWLFKTSIFDIFTPIKNYRGIYGVWGIGQLIFLFFSKLDPSLIQIIRRFFLISFFMFSLFFYQKNILKNILTIMLFFFSFTLTFGAHWLSWMMPFILIKKPAYWRFFIFITNVYLLFTFTTDVYPLPKHLINLFVDSIMFTGFATWFTIILMFRKSLKRS